MIVYRVPSDLAWVAEGFEDGTPVVYLLRVPDGTPLVLSGTAALIWFFAAQGENAATALAGVVDDPPIDLPQVTASYLSDLVASGLLLEVGSAAAG